MHILKPCILLHTLSLFQFFLLSSSLTLSSHAERRIVGYGDCRGAMGLLAALLSRPDHLTLSGWKNKVSPGRIPSQAQRRESGSVLQRRVGHYLWWRLHLGQRSCSLSPSRVCGGSKLVAQCQVWTGHWWVKNKSYFYFSAALMFFTSESQLSLYTLRKR